MIEFEASVFFDEDDFAVRCVRVRPGEGDVEFAGILGESDDEQFEGQVQARTHQLQYAAAAVDLQPEDRVVTTGADEAGALLAARTWRVLRTPQLTVDGLECLVWLSPDEDA